MRNVFAFVLAAGLGLSLPAAADVLTPQQVLVTSDREAARHEKALGELFDQLKHQRQQAEAERIANRISAELTRSGSDTVDLIMGWAADAIKTQKFDVALDFLDQVIVLKPDYVEAYNRRATAHFLMKNFALAMRDIEHVLEVEPRHFGALAGMAQILESTGQDELALRAYERVLDVYPTLRSAQDDLARLADKLAGERA